MALLIVSRALLRRGGWSRDRTEQKGDAGIRNFLFKIPCLHHHLHHSKQMEFEDILRDVGGFGAYQRALTFFFLVPAFVAIPMFSMNSIFYSSAPDHWCRVPAAANLSAHARRALPRPHGDPHCSAFDVDLATLLFNSSSSTGADQHDWPTKPCDAGWEYDNTNYDVTSVTRWDMVCRDEHYTSLVLSLVFIGDVVGTPFYGYLSDKWGRKPTFLLMAAVIAISDIGSVLSPYFWLFLTLRALNGTAMSTVYGVGYIIILELVSAEKRTRINGIGTTSWTLGLCLLPLLAYLTRDWRLLSAATSAMAAALLLYARWLPESPSWLISQERYDEAAEIMAKISKTNGKTLDKSQLLQRIQRLGEREKKARVNEKDESPMDFFRYPTLRKRFLIVTVCWVGNSLPYFGLQMNVRNLGGNEFFNFFLVSLVEVPAHCATWVFMERAGRRWCSVGAFALSAAACLAPVIAPPEYGLVGVIASLLAKVGTSAAFMTLYQQGPELFPTALRGVGLGMACTIGTGSTLVVPYIVWLAKFGTYIPFLAFAIITAISGVCAAFLPETLGKRLPQTVEEADRFETDTPLFPCCSGTKSNTDEEESTIENTWSPRTLSAIDLASNPDAIGFKKTSLKIIDKNS